MSHAVVLVIGDDIDSQLAPYSEQIEVEPYKDFEDEPKQFVAPRDGKLHWNWPYSAVADDGIDPRNAAAVAAHLNAKWSDDEKYDVEDGRLYHWSTYNPQSKWDWYRVGGRWAGTLLIKPLVVAAAPNVSVNPFSSELAAQELKHFEPVMDGRHADRARKGEIDWPGMLLERLSKIDARWDGYEKVLREQGPEAAEREAWWSYGLEKEDLERGRDGHLAREAALHPLHWIQAVVAEGIWREKGRMGWFGMSSDGPEEREQWQDWFSRFMDGMPDEAMLTIVDYHI